MNKFLVEIFIWQNSGLVLSRKYFPNARTAMDYAYSQPFDVMKVYDDDGYIMHQNAKSKEMESYA